MAKKGRKERKHVQPKKPSEQKGERIKFAPEVNRRLLQSKRITSLLLVVPAKGKLSWKAMIMLLERMGGLKRYACAVAGENENPSHYSLSLQLDQTGVVSLYEAPKLDRKK